MAQDGNVALKVTWVYGKEGPFTSPCTPPGRESNIRAGRVWCSQPECLCNKLYRSANTREVVFNEHPCMDSEIFLKWTFGAGTYHHGPKRGEPIPIKHARPGRLAFFTSRRGDMKEGERIVLASFEIDDIGFDSKKSLNYLSAKPGSQIKVALSDFNRAPRLWDFYRVAGSPSWGTGLFRYLTDPQAKGLRDALEVVAKQVS
jgi:hypothetical protein